MALVLTVLLIIRKNGQKSKDPEAKPLPKFGKQALLAGLLGLAFAGWPFWLTDLTINIRSPFNSRFTMAFMPWIALFFTAFLHWLSRIRSGLLRFLNLALIAFMVGGSAGYHYWNANIYRNEWLVTQRYFQQMVHRIPDLKPGTTLVINDLRALSLYQDNSLTAILNWTYAPEKADPEIDYMVHYLSVRLGRQLPALEPGLPIDHQIRSQHFSGSTDQLLVVYYQPPGCLRVLDYEHPERLPEDFPEAMLPALPLSKPGLIVTSPAEPAMPPLHLFEEEDSETWCLYFEEADLAAQLGDWPQVANVGDRALELEDQSNEVSELFVFIEGYLRMGRMGRAKDLSETVSGQSGGYFDDAICGLWQEVDQDLGEDFARNFDLVPIYERYCSSWEGP